MASLHGNLGDDFLYGLEGAAAVEELGHAVEFLENNDPKAREVAVNATDLGFAQLLAGRPEDALATFEKALGLWETVAPQHPLRAMGLLGRHQALLALGREGRRADLEAALPLAKALVEEAEKGSRRRRSRSSRPLAPAPTLGSRRTGERRRPSPSSPPTASSSTGRPSLGGGRGGRAPVPSSWPSPTSTRA